MSTQAKLESLIETVFSTVIGFCVSFLAWPLIAPLFGIEYTMASNVGITTIFTVLSIARGYVVRRFFASGLHKAAVQLAGKVSWQ